MNTKESVTKNAANAIFKKTGLPYQAEKMTYGQMKAFFTQQIENLFFAHILRTPSFAKGEREETYETETRFFFAFPFIQAAGGHSLAGADMTDPQLKIKFAAEDQRISLSFLIEDYKNQSELKAPEASQMQLAALDAFFDRMNMLKPLERHTEDAI